MTCFTMRTHQSLKIFFFFLSFASSFPQRPPPSRRSNAELASTPENQDPEYVVEVRRTVTVGDTTINIGAYTVGAPGGGGTPVPATTTTSKASTVTSSGHSTKTSTSPPIPTNPWASACTVPSSFTVNNFVFVSGTGGDVSFAISYGNGTVISCPNQGQEYLARGVYDLTCGNNSLVHAQTDGFSWLFVNEKYSCGSSGSATLAASTNYTSFGDNLFCDTDDANVKTCLQLDPNIAFPVLHYDTTGSITH